MASKTISKRRKRNTAATVETGVTTVPESGDLSPAQSEPGTPTVTISQEMTDGKLKLMQSSPLARLLQPLEGISLPKQSESPKKPQKLTLLSSVKKPKPSSAKAKKAQPLKTPPKASVSEVAKISDNKAHAGKPSSVLYVGHIPHGFYEKEMRLYFAQFGNINRLRLSRAPKTGASRGFAFIDFEDSTAAAAAAEAMQGYLMHGRSLKAHVVPLNKLHPETFKGAHRPFTKFDWIGKMRLESSKKSKDKKKLNRRQKKIEKKHRLKKEQLQRLGMNFEVPDIVKPEAS